MIWFIKKTVVNIQSMHPCHKLRKPQVTHHKSKVQPTCIRTEPNLIFFLKIEPNLIATYF
jgi:hypothetical protein